ncbi:RNA pseudouridine synthase 3, mitochondrial isoform X2 [Nymphaea colorata]|uniref:RNA pseudouridine synthase 3, mitochondrial isoform X2 n=1 Tax=Nymphaea colorata TaxID=210225 RepID=UPI00129D8091|nr:RNA pseudouridine synthase 3, mitochondrial isoform X2 [Nymphaea colorata]
MVGRGGIRQAFLALVRRYSKTRASPPPPARVVLRVVNNVAKLEPARTTPRARQLFSLPPFPGVPSRLPGRRIPPVAEGQEGGASSSPRVTAITWLRYYLKDVPPKVIRRHFNKGQVKVESFDLIDSLGLRNCQMPVLKRIRCNEVMETGMKVCVPVSVCEGKVKKRYDTIPHGTLYPNADEIEYIRRLVMYKDSAIIVINKPPRMPVKGNLPVHNSMDALAAAALSYGNREGPKLVHRLDSESSGIHLLGRSSESIARLHLLFSDRNRAKTSLESWNYAVEATAQRFWALVIGTPKEKEGVISAPLAKVILKDGKTERVILAHSSGIDASQEAITEYRVLGPTVNGCSWIELLPVTGRKHQLRVHCAEALGTPIVGDYKYGWYVHKKWKQMDRIDIDPETGEPYRMRRPEGLDVQKGSVLSKVPLLHLYCREMVIPNIAKFMEIFQSGETTASQTLEKRPDVLRFVAQMPSHMKISWNIMSSFLV